ncbi:ComF family protein [Angustibacter sp. McL0619]|uniref:ComF family protein n=1 Tax=Angustibacter sp. McL0619 TaxID=3415676 RepID=UPI003CF3B98D
MTGLADLLLARTCGGCGVTGTRWCPSCASSLIGPVLATNRGPLQVWSAANYDGALREALNAWKDHGRADLDGVLAMALAGVLDQVDPDQVDLDQPGPDQPGPDQAHPDHPDTDRPGQPAALVPVPSSASARRARGRHPVRDLALAVRPRRRVLPGLRHARPLADQAGLDAAARASNLHGALRVRAGWLARLRSAGPVLLIDDVVTSGATLLEAHRALETAGVQVRGAVCVAATVRRI